MDISAIQAKYAPVLRQYMFPIGLGLIGIVLLLYGLIASLNHKNASDILAEGISDKAISEEKSILKMPGIILDVEGAVMNPGVYELKKNARLQDALIAAGGLSDKADREKVAKGLNLASKVVDGGKIYIPFVGESSSVAIGGSTSLAQAGDSTDQSVMGDQTGLININSATEQQLDSLPGVGIVTAGKIINNRPYARIEDLLSKKAVGQSVFGKIKDKISVF